MPGRGLLVVAAATLALAAGGCGDDGAPSADGSATITIGGRTLVGPDTPAAGFRASLTADLVAQVFLEANAVGQAIRAPDSPDARAAAQVLEAGSDAFTARIARAVGMPAAGRTRLTALWRHHDDLLVTYGRGRAARDELAVQQALADLDAFRMQFADLVGEGVDGLDTGKLAEDLKSHVETLAAAIDRLAAGEPPARQLADAVVPMPTIASRLAAGVVGAEPKRFPGATDAGGSVLRATLTARMVADAHLTLRTANAVVAKQPAAATATRAALDENAGALADTLSSVYGEDAGQTVRGHWRQRAALLTRYVRAKAAKDAAAATEALDGLAAISGDVITQLAELDPKLERQPLAHALEHYDETLTGAVRASATSSPKRFARAAAAGDAGAQVAATLAHGIAVQFPDKFGAR